ncbi:MAG TPA: hypothetical protein VML58_14325 [Burkholderiaceae bacterium]|nr:hypothetical protein [Burkholderiaceae bacterium]
MIGDPPGRDASGRSLFLPSLLVSLALVVWLGFQTWQLVAERQQLRALHASQVATVETATKVRSSLDAVASQTAKLALQGNSNAGVIVEGLRKRGVTINPDGPTKN